MSPPQLVEATRNLLWEAYRDPLNQRWVGGWAEGQEGNTGRLAGRMHGTSGWRLSLQQRC